MSVFKNQDELSSAILYFLFFRIGRCVLPIGVFIFASTHSTRHFHRVFHVLRSLAKLYREVVAYGAIGELDGARFQLVGELAPYLFEICPFQ